MSHPILLIPNNNNNNNNVFVLILQFLIFYITQQLTPHLLLHHLLLHKSFYSHRDLRSLMAIFLARSRATAVQRYVRKNVGFSEIILGVRSSCNSSSSSSSSSSSNIISQAVAGKYFRKHLLPSSCNTTKSFSTAAGRFKSTAAAVDSSFVSESDDDQALDFPGGKVTYTPEMKFISESSDKRVPCYRVLDDNGELINGSHFAQLSKEVAVKMYGDMVTLQIMDFVLYEAQRQGRFSFYMTTIGEEAINIGSAAALKEDDLILPQYREPGVLLWRGYTLQQFTNQLFANKDDDGKGRQMPVHYGSKKHNYVTISSPIATQLPQAAGMAYSLKMDKKDACVVAYIGDGGTSEGDFHAGLNFAAVTEAPVVFICRNNGWAISTNISEQFRSDGIVVKGRGYGIKSIRVDGNDALAVYSAIRAAREIAVTEQKPVLVETLSYRVGHHSTSDDSTKYRTSDEIQYWKMERNPVNRFRNWIERNGWWSEQQESELRSSIRKQLLQAMQTAEKTEKPPITEMFSDVYDVLPANLLDQEKQLTESIRKHPKDFPTDFAV
ncbi:2-oxoisovalerate dehydrogenase subunit alpha 2, mitochondrial [Melia azedarach]|uniref:2-oxoisovalerate dehydrogenase subunit alpha 2, mitochondrial n=1 Tax=Melia azedarach TaxID=155640 RepID=A0ACC1WR89_MELAZ|nr:2-oxoisovalerate dehydrogenase subunit alpha 2, mitochondrial [Melia azedarach]